MASKMTEAELKGNIKSLLTSTTMQVTIGSLQRDFREMIGEQIPFLKFKYNSVEHLLKSIPDTCEVRGTGPHAQVFLVRSEKSGHMDALVAGQKVNTKGRRQRGFSTQRRHRVSIYMPPYNRSPIQPPPRFRGQPYNNNYAMSPNTSHSSDSLCSYTTGSVANKLMAYTNSPINTQTNNTNFNPSQNVQSRSTAETKPVNTSFSNQNSQTTKAAETKAAIEEQNKSSTQLRKEKLNSLIENQIKLGIVKTDQGNTGESWIKVPDQVPILAPAEMLPSTTNKPKTESRYTRHDDSTRRNIENWIEANAQVMEPLPNFTNGSSRNVENWHRSPLQTPCSEEIIEPLERLTVTNDDKNKPELSAFDKVKEDVEEDISSVPNRVQDHLKILIGEFPEGIWVSELPKHYQRMFRKELMFNNYGYASLIEMCVALKHIFHYARPGKDDFKLYDRSKPLPASAEKLYTMASYDIGKKIENLHSCQEALPELDWSDFHGQIPEDVFRLGRIIPRQFLPEDVKEESILDVVVVEAYDPSKFWIYLGTSQEDTDLDRLMEEIQDFYCYEETAREYAIPPGLIKENLYCVQEIYREYHRALIVHVYPEEEYVKVFCIDYGSTVKVPMRGMCFLHNKFAELPAQAIRCSLANIIPTMQGHPWSHTVKDRFRELINHRQTKINISHIDHEQLLVWVFLADVTNPKKVVYINNVLVKEKHALWDEEVQETPLLMTNLTCKVENLHLFPTHLELEYGTAPSVTEIYSFDDMLVPVYFYLPNYFTLHDQDQILTNRETFAKQIYPSFIKTVTTRHSATNFANWTNALTTIHKPAKIHFSVFNDLEEALIDYYKPTMEISESTIINNEKLKRDIQLMEEDMFCDVEDDFLGENAVIQSPSRAAENLEIHSPSQTPGNVENQSPSNVKYTKEELLNISDSDKDLPNSVTMKLTKHKLLHEVSSSSGHSEINSIDQLPDEQLPIITELRYSREQLLLFNIRNNYREDLPNSVIFILTKFKLLNEESCQRNVKNTTNQLPNEKLPITSQLRYSREELFNLRNYRKKLPNSVIFMLKKCKLLNEVSSSQRIMQNSTNQLCNENLPISSPFRYVMF